jgi:tetratricopeptide (TPR) repeat protein
MASSTDDDVSPFDPRLNAPFVDGVVRAGGDPRAPSRPSPAMVRLRTVACGLAGLPSNGGQPAREGDLAAFFEGVDDRIAAAERAPDREDEDAVRRLLYTRVLRAMRTFERGDREGARREWQALADQHPQAVAPLIARALFFENVGEVEAALVDYGQAIARAPDDPDGYFYRGMSFALRSDWPRAAADFRRLVHLVPHDVEALVALGESLVAIRDFDAAIRILTRAIKLAPRRARAYRFRAQAYQARFAYDDELRDVERWIALAPDDADAYQHRADTRLLRDDQDGYLADLSRAIELDPEHVLALRARAGVRHQQRQYELAVADLSQALAAEPGDHDVFRERAAVYLAMGAFDQAIADYDQLLRLVGPHDARGLWRRGHAYLRRGDPKRALADYRRALEEKPSLTEGLRTTMEWYLQAGFTTHARQALDTLLLLEPSSPELLLVRARLLAEAGEAR